MAKYLVRHNEGSDPTVIATYEHLGDAIAARFQCPYDAHVLHVASGLELHKVGIRLIWLDEFGREHPAPAKA